MYRNVPPYTSFTDTMCALGPRELIIVAVVDEPEENARACAPPASMEARVSSRALRFGFPDLEYSKPYAIVSKAILTRGRSFTDLMVAYAVLLVGCAQGNGGDYSARLRAGFGANMDSASTEA
jgi:hypothetical protein